MSCFLQRKLCRYIEANWLSSTTWPPETWSVFNRSVRTNNDVEGWHRRLNGKAMKGQLNFYLLVQLLASEAAVVDLQIQLLKESNVICRQRESSRATARKLFVIWGRVIDGSRNIRQTLRSASHLMPF